MRESSYIRLYELLSCVALVSVHGMEFGVSITKRALHDLDRRRYPLCSFGGEDMHHISMADLESYMKYL
jgi:hypothetical protein